MKRFVFLILSMSILNISYLFATGETIRTKGKWGDNIIRTIFPKAPLVSVDESVLSIYCADSLSDLTVTVVDADGKVVLQECITISSGETVHFTLSEITGTYQVRLNHEYGYLVGDFVM